MRARLGRRLAACAIALAIVFCAPVARADVERFALLLGNDRGAPDEPALRFAGADAAGLRDVLVDLGGFSPANTILLEDADVDEARRALIGLNDRIRARTARPGAQVVLFVYYSGHADGSALQLGASRFDLDELEQLVRGSAASFRLLLIDACRSGALTRVKGGSPAPQFPIALGEQLQGEGVVFLTSSAASEDAQESDALGGSFFTHYFRSGLLGAADANGDGRVDLEEAYAYAYEATLRATSRTWSGTQHPTFRFELGGEGALVLTHLQGAGGRATLVFPGGRAYLVFRDTDSGPVVGEVVAETASRRLSLRPGRYFVRARASDFLLEGDVTVGKDQTLAVTDGMLQRIDYARLVRKGHAERSSAEGVLGGFTTRSAIGNSTGACNGVFAGYSVALAAITLSPRIDFCLGGFENQELRATANEFGGHVRGAHAWDLRRVSLDLGLSAGASWLRQTFATAGRAPPRDTVAFRGGISGGVAVDIAAGFFALAELTGETYVFRLLDVMGSSTSVVAEVALRGTVGVEKLW